MHRRASQKGFLLISTLAVVTVLIIIVTFYLHAIIKQTQFNAFTNLIPRTRTESYGAIEYVLYLLSHDAAARTSFTENPTWTATFTSPSNNANTVNTASISNTRAADADIYATSTVAFKTTNGVRAIRAHVFAPASTTPRANTALYARNTIESIGGHFSLSGGEVFTNGSITLSLTSDWTSNSDVYARGIIATSADSVFTAQQLYDSIATTTPEWVDMVSMDFDATGQSLYATADSVYTESAFDALLASSPLVLNGITYITGNARIPQGTDITINGMLVAGGSIIIAHTGTSTAETAITINHINGNPAGIAAKQNIIFGPNDINADIDGIIYAGNSMHFSEQFSIRQSIAITGALIANTLTLSPRQSTITLTYNDTILTESMRPSPYHPLVLTEVTEIKK